MSDPREQLHTVPDPVEPRGWAAVLAWAERVHEAFTEEGPWGVVDYYMDGRPRWEIALGIGAMALAAGVVVGVVVTVLAMIAAFFTATAKDVSSTGLLQTVDEPVRAYLDKHAQGLPATPRTLYWAWLAAAVLLLLGAFSGSWGARVGWTLLGALTAAMVWAGATPHSSRWTAAGVAVALWSVLSVAAFKGAFRRARIVVLPPPPGGSAPDRRP